MAKAKQKKVKKMAVVRQPRPRGGLDESIVVNFTAVQVLGAGDASGDSQTAIQITNRMFGTTTTGPLARYANLYQLVKLRELEVEYVPTIALTAPGMAVMAYDYDGTNEHAAGSPSTLLQQSGSVYGPAAFQPGRPLRCKYKLSDRSRLPITTDLVGAAAVSFNSANSEFLVHQAYKTTASVSPGFLVARVKCEFMRPRVV